MRTFRHDWDPDEYQHNTMSADLPLEAIVRMSVDDEGGFWLEANRAGFAFLSRFFAELSDSDLEVGWHDHRSADFSTSTGAPEFTFAVVEES